MERLAVMDRSVVVPRRPENDLSLVQIPGSNMPSIKAGEAPDSLVTSIHEAKAENKDGYLTPEQQRTLNLLQEKVKKSVMQYLDQSQAGDLSPLVAMATGIGKGRIIHLLIEEQMRRNPDSKVLLIVGTKNTLVRQSHMKLSEYQQLENLAEDIYEYVEAENEDELVQETTDIEENPLEGQTSSEYTTGRIGNINANVHLATIQTTQFRIATNRLNPSDYDLVLVDEVHNVGTPKRKDTIDRFRKVAGFTATPHRNSGVLIAPEEYGFTIIESFSLPEAQNAGFIPPLLGVQVNTTNLISEIPTNRTGQINYRKLEKLLRDSPDLLPYIADRIHRLIISPEGRTYKTIIAVNFVWEAEELAKLLNEKGLRVGVAVNQKAARSIHTEDIPAKDSIERYHLPKDDPKSIDLLISPYVASEGFDAPFTEAVVWASPTQSGLRYTQFTGRVTRRYPGKPFGLIIDFLYQTNQHTWSLNMARWAKEHVKRRNGLLYLGPADKIESITDSVSAQAVEQKLIEEDKMPLMSLQEDYLEDIKETDAEITIRWLKRTFGKGQSVRILVNQVLQELEANEDTRGLIKQRKSGSHTVTVVTDKKLFIEKVLAKGVKLKQEKILKVQKTDAKITTEWLERMFIGARYEPVRALVDEVLQELEANEDTRGLIKQRKNGNFKPVTVVTDKNSFIKMMLARGAKLNPPKILTVQETATPITHTWIRDAFENRREAIVLAEQVLQELSENEATKGSIVQGKSARHIVTLVTDQKLFIEMMLNKGAMLKKT